MTHGKRYLSIDYGDARVGFAVNYVTLAEPLSVVSTASAMQAAHDYVQEYAISSLVVGIAEGPMAEKVRVFAQELVRQFPSLTVHEVDETGSSRDVHEQQYEQKVSRQKRQRPIDHFSAARCLQWYMDTLPQDEREVI